MGDSKTKGTVIKVLVVILAMIVVAVITVFVTLAFVPDGEAVVGPCKAVAVINVGTATSRVAGQLELNQNSPSSPVIITGQITGLTPNRMHGFHVHGLGDVRNGCASTGSHFNPANVNHGGPTDAIRHVGDLGNVVADAEGKVDVSISDNIISLSGRNSIIGRAFVVHADEDDLGKGRHNDSLTTGHAGNRIGCGLIGLLTL